MADENAPPQSQDDDELFSRENLRLISIVGGGTISVISAGVLFRELAQRSRGSKSDQTHFRVDDPREIMANQLLARGHASVDEILAASFGEWPPKGLDIVTAQPQRVPFHNIPEDVQQRTIERIGARAAGNATLVRERNIGIMMAQHLCEMQTQLLVTKLYIFYKVIIQADCRIILLLGQMNSMLCTVMMA
jgi:hypothetical protein